LVAFRVLDATPMNTAQISAVIATYSPANTVLAKNHCETVAGGLVKKRTMF